MRYGRCESNRASGSLASGKGRKGQSGQVAVEAALMLPFTVFMVLGILQLSLMQQARLLTQYAAYRAARAGSLGQVGTTPGGASCQQMTDAAVEGILPSYGRTDSASAISTTWTTNNSKHGYPKENKTNVTTGVTELQKIVNVSYVLSYINGAPSNLYEPTDFDDPGHGLRLQVQVLYNYEMRIPFANWMLHEMWTGGNYFNDKIDMLSPSKNTAPDLNGPPNQTRIDHTTDLSGSSTGWRFFLPIPASSSMRMMSNPVAGVTVGTSTVTCP